MIGARPRSTINMAAAAPLAISLFASSFDGAAPKVTAGPERTPSQAVAKATVDAPTQRWSLLGGERCELVIRSVGQAAGSRGLSVECEADPDQQLTIRIDAKVQSGRWTLRVDDGEQPPNWLPLGGYPAARVTGSKRYRFLIYSDDVDSAISIRDVTVRPAVDADDELTLVWPTGGPVVEMDRARRSAQWRALFGIRDSDSAIAQAKRIADWVHERSRIVGIADPRHVSLRSPWHWRMNQSGSIDGDCGTYTNATLEALANCEIDSRPVYLGTRAFEAGKNLHDTHALVEIFDKAQGRWMLVDPTFNVVFVGSDGAMLGIAELMALSNSGGKWEPVQIGAPKPGRALTEYYLPFGELLWMADAPAVTRLGSAGAAFRSRDLTVKEVARAKYPSPGPQ